MERTGGMLCIVSLLQEYSVGQSCSLYPFTEWSKIVSLHLMRHFSFSQTGFIQSILYFLEPSVLDMEKHHKFRIWKFRLEIMNSMIL